MNTVAFLLIIADRVDAGWPEPTGINLGSCLELRFHRPAGRIDCWLDLFAAPTFAERHIVEAKYSTLVVSSWDCSWNGQSLRMVSVDAVADEVAELTAATADPGGVE